MTSFLRSAILLSLGAVVLAQTAPAPSGEEKVRVLVVTGGHSYDTSFYTVFEGYPDLTWSHATSSHEAFRKDVRPDYDVLVFYNLHANDDDITDAEKKNLVDFAESGKGIVVLHHAIANYPGWDWWSKELVHGKYLLKQEGDRPRSTYKAGVEIAVESTMQHPVTRGVAPLTIWDEAYKGMWIAPDVQVLLKTNHEASDSQIAWISPYSKSRVVYIELGHDRRAHTNPGYRQLVKNAIDWAGGRK
ncbi:MAG: ThuA domain-containing protein [Bryobacteraceae bacterium]